MHETNLYGFQSKLGGGPVYNFKSTINKNPNYFLPVVNVSSVQMSTQSLHKNELFDSKNALTSTTLNTKRDNSPQTFLSHFNQESLVDSRPNIVNTIKKNLIKVIDHADMSQTNMD
jgi:hypothetical protein